MAKQSFVTGQVLTAQQVNDLQTNDFNQTVSAKTASYTLVAADKGTRITMSSTSATTITVNTGLFAAGDTLFIQNLNTGVCTITAGTATVDTSASLALAQHEGGTLYFTSAGVSTFFKAAGATASGGFSLINRTTISAAATTTVDSLFSDTYENYYLVLNYGMSSAGNNAILKFRYASTTHSANYFYGSNGAGTTGSETNDWYGHNISAITFPAVGATQIFSYSAFINRSSTASRALIGQHHHNDGLYNNIFRLGGFAINSAQAWGGIELTTNAGTLSGVLSVYGLAKS